MRVTSLRTKALLGLGLLGFLTAGTYAATVSTRVSASMATTQASTLDMGSASYSPSLTYTRALANGTGNYQIQTVYSDTGRIALSDSVLVDLNGSLSDAFGASIACATLKGIMVTADSANTNDVLVGGARVAQVDFLGNALGGAADTNHLVPVGPGGVFLWTRPKTGATVTATTRDILRLKNSGAGTSVKYGLQLLCT